MILLINFLGDGGRRKAFRTEIRIDSKNTVSPYCLPTANKVTQVCELSVMRHNKNETEHQLI